MKGNFEEMEGYEKAKGKHAFLQCFPLGYEVGGARFKTYTNRSV